MILYSLLRHHDRVGLASKGNVTKGAIEKATRDLPTAVKRTLQASIDRMLLAVSGKIIVICKGENMN